MFLGMEFRHLIEMMWPPLPSLKEPIRGIASRPNFWSTFFEVAIVAPVAEEFLFRGLILHGLSRNHSRSKAILVSALLFALFHANALQFAGAFVLGVVFAWWTIETGSLLPCIVGHQLINLGRLVASVIGRSRIAPRSMAAETHVTAVWLKVGVLGTVFFVTGAWIFIRSTMALRAPRNQPSST
jgi:membrane protease YdiL (CAAX protease family)